MAPTVLRLLLMHERGSRVHSPLTLHLPCPLPCLCRRRLELQGELAKGSAQLYRGAVHGAIPVVQPVSRCPIPCTRCCCCLGMERRGIAAWSRPPSLPSLAILRALLMRRPG